MKNKWMVVLGMAALVVFMAHNSLAQEAGSFGIGARAGYYGISDDDVQGDDVEFPGAFYGNVNLTYFVTEMFSFELGAGYTKADVEIDPAGGVEWDAGEVTVVPVELVARYHIVNDTPFTPYLGLGGGFYSINFDPVLPNWQANTVATVSDVEAENSFGFIVNGGLDWLFSENAAVNLDLRYTWNESEFDLVGAGTQQDVSMNAFSAGLGIKLYF